CLFFNSGQLMNIPFFETSASNFSYVVNGNECVLIDFVDDFFHFAVFEPVNDAGDFFVLLVRVSAVDDVVGGISAKSVIDGLDKQLRFLRDDCIRFGAAESFFDQLDHFGGDEISDSGKESAFQAEDKGNNDKDEYI